MLMIQSKILSRASTAGRMGSIGLSPSPAPSITQNRGAFIVLEGLDRSGKTSQCLRLVSFLHSQGIPAESWRFPDRSTAIGNMISAYLSSAVDLDDNAVHLLFSANRWEKRSLMEAKLRSGTTLIVDRYSFSGVAFSAAKGLDLNWCKDPERGLIAPDLVIYLDMPAEIAAGRGDYGVERYENLDFQIEVAKKYKVLQDSTWQNIDASKSMNEVHEMIQKASLEVISKCKMGMALHSLWDHRS